MTKATFTKQGENEKTVSGTDGQEIVTCPDVFTQCITASGSFKQQGLECLLF